MPGQPPARLPHGHSNTLILAPQRYENSPPGSSHPRSSCPPSSPRTPQPVSEVSRASLPPLLGERGLLRQALRCGAGTHGGTRATRLPPPLPPRVACPVLDTGSCRGNPVPTVGYGGAAIPNNQRHNHIPALAKPACKGVGTWAPAGEDGRRGYTRQVQPPPIRPACLSTQAILPNRRPHHQQPPALPNTRPASRSPASRKLWPHQCRPLSCPRP